MLRVAFDLSRILLEGFGELEFITELVVHPKITVAPRFSLDSLRDCRSGTHEFNIELIEIRREDVDANR